MAGTTFKRCGCRDAQTGRLVGRRCPRLRRRGGGWSSDHGVWHYQLELPSARPGGPRRQLRRGGFTIQTEAQADLNHAHSLLSLAEPDDEHTRRQIADLLLDTARTGGRLPATEQVRRRLHAGTALTDLPLLGDWLPDWLRGRRRISRNTRRSYEAHIRLHLTPHLGHLRIDRLRTGHIGDMFDAIADHNQRITDARATGDPTQVAAVRGLRVIGPATMHRIRATLRKALNDAIRQHLITTNPAVHVELPSGHRPKPLIWTDERVRRWKDTGHIPSKVMVWTPAHTGAFLDHATGDRLYPLYHLIAYRGLRRGEACGLHWDDLDLTAGALTVRWQLVQHGWATALDTPKTPYSEAIIALDTGTIAVLKEQRQRQDAERIAAGTAWTDTGLVFTTPLGEPLHPADVSDRFKQLAADAGLPPVRLHDLRHGAATLALAAGADLKTIQQLLRHSSITITADTYTSVLPTLAHDTAEATARLVPRTPPQTA